jgi:hypothetical protein
MENSGITFPQRKIKKSYRSVTGHFPSVKNDRSVAFESLLEKQLFLTLEFDDAVESYMEQPRIEVKNGGRSRTYNLDCHIRYTSASKKDAIVEVKYVSELQKEKEKLERKFNRIEPAVTEMGMEFVLFTDETYSPTYISNLDFLYRYKTQRFHDEYNSAILGSVEAPISALDLANSLANSKTEYFQLANAIWALVAEGELRADLQKEELTMNSLVWRNDGRH